MNRFQMALLMSMLLGSQAWAQPMPAPVRNIPPSTDPVPADPGVVSPSPDGFTAPAPTQIAPTFDDSNDSCGCGGCANMSHPWRSLKNRLGGGLAGGDTCSCDPVCGPPGRVWFGADVLYWHVGGDPIPPLVSSSPTNGVLPNAAVLVGNQNFNNDFRAGLRVNAGVWFTDRHSVGFQGGAFQLLDQSQNANFASGGTPILARPFNNLNVAASSQIVSFPGAAAGNVGVSERNTLQGLDLALRGIVCCGDTWRLDALIGYRHLRFTEQLLIQEHIVALAPNSQTVLGLPPGTVVDSFDRFDTGNEFHALQVGFTGDVRLWEKLTLSGTAKASFGVMQQGVGIDGATRFSTDTAPRVGGLLALNSNIGAYHRSDNTLVPELTLCANYQFNSRICFRAGYDLLYLPNVQRAGSTIDTTIDPARIPPIGTPSTTNVRPVFGSGGNASDLLIQGVHAGFEIRF